MPRVKRQLVLGSLLAAAFTAQVSHAGSLHPGLDPSATFSVPANGGSAAPPAMGWNPWNAFRTEVTEQKIFAVADALKKSGLADAGYRYVNIDDGWWLRRRANGRIDIRTSMFPSADIGNGETSLRPFVDHLHAMGLKAGLYTDIGRNACSQIWDQNSPNLPVGSRAEREIGSLEYQIQDMNLFFGEWTFDFLKVDACGLADFAPGKPAVRSGKFRALGPYIVRGRPDRSDAGKVETLYASLQKAIAAVRPNGDYVLSICTWGEANVADWGKRYGNLWRTSPDIRPSWGSMLKNFDSAATRALYAGPGRRNDPDMLEIGNGAFDASHPVEARAHLSLWAIMGAPLILSYDLTRAPRSLIDIVGNREVIAIDQDAAGNQGVVVSKDRDTEVIVKSLAVPGTKAVALVNRGANAVTASVSLARLNLDPEAATTVRDLWSRKERALAGDKITVALAPHETALLLVKGQAELKNGLYLSEMPGRINVAVDGRATLARPLKASWTPAQVNAAPSGEPLSLDGKRFQNGLGVLGNSRLVVRLDKQFSRFRATVGVLDDTRYPGVPHAVSYRLYGDGRLLLDKLSSGKACVEVPVQGVSVLELVAENAKDTDQPLAIAWADARLER